MPRSGATHDYFVADPAGLSSYLERDGLALPEANFFRVTCARN